MSESVTLEQRGWFIMNLIKCETTYNTRRQGISGYWSPPPQNTIQFFWHGYLIWYQQKKYNFTQNKVIWGPIMMLHKTKTMLRTAFNYSDNEDFTEFRASDLKGWFEVDEACFS